MFETILYSLTALVVAGVPLYAWQVRGRTYATFGAVILLMSMPGVLLAEARFESWFAPAWLPVFRGVALYCIAVAGVHLAHLVRARMRSRVFRLLVSVPGQATVAAGFMMSLWLMAAFPLRWIFAQFDFDIGLAILSWLDLVPILVSLISIATSARPVEEWVRVRLGEGGPSEVSRVPVERHRGRVPPPLAERPLRIVQITDPHLGPWQSVRALRATVAGLLEKDPDLVLLTGDFLTMESMGSPGALHEALEPLRDREGSCFAIFGNHDHEAPDEVRGALEANGIHLLIDEEVVVEAPAGPVQLIGSDYVRRDRAEHLEKLLSQHPRIDGHLRLLMLHDPLGFRDIAEGEIDLVLSGHTHGGQVGLVSLGFDWTVLSRSAWPDHGLFARGSNRLYVHRGTGFYGFPLRVGVPGEASVMELIY
jgi:predicted MPP superfamily phosphohydrolase